MLWYFQVTGREWDLEKTSYDSAKVVWNMLMESAEQSATRRASNRTRTAARDAEKSRQARAKEQAARKTKIDEYLDSVELSFEPPKQDLRQRDRSARDRSGHGASAASGTGSGTEDFGRVDLECLDLLALSDPSMISGPTEYLRYTPLEKLYPHLYHATTAPRAEPEGCGSGSESDASTNSL
jgi:hypothetical protein